MPKAIFYLLKGAYSSMHGYTLQNEWDYHSAEEDGEALALRLQRAGVEEETAAAIPKAFLDLNLH